VFINKKFPYFELERTTNDDGTRFYLDPNTNNPLPSITTILSATADKSFLIEWQNRVGLKKAEEIRNEASALGTLLHTHMECHIQGIPRPKGSNLIRMLAERMANVIIKEALPHVDEIWGQEVPLYYPNLFAGTSDLIGNYQGQPAIMDFKNTKKMKTKEMITDYFCQAAAYSICHNEVFGTNINTAAIFMVDRQLNYETFVVEGEEFKKYETMFLLRLEKYLSSH
jgi:genome maintenance exonuclease 1